MDILTGKIIAGLLSAVERHAIRPAITPATANSKALVQIEPAVGCKAGPMRPTFIDAPVYIDPAPGISSAMIER